MSRMPTCPYTWGEKYALLDLALYAPEHVTTKPIDVLVGTDAGHHVLLQVANINLNTPGIYIGQNTSYHERRMPPQIGEAFLFVHPLTAEIPLIQFANIESIWYEGFAPLLDSSWKEGAYRKQRLQLLKILSNARTQEEQHG